MIKQDPADWKTPAMIQLFADIAQLRSPEELAAFFRDACTIGELNEVSRRWQAAKLLADGTTVRAVVAETGLSSATVSRVNQWKNNLGSGGYNLLIDRLKK